jgi:predicted site-specific integrase-resolvase
MTHKLRHCWVRQQYRDHVYDSLFMAPEPRSLASQTMEASTQVGYARVSTQDQDLTAQRDCLRHCEKLFEETASGIDALRPQL